MRERLKDAEFYLPPAVSSLVIAATRVVPDPYTPEMDARRCIFIHIPKTAGTSIANAVFETRTRHIPAARFKAVDPRRFDAYFKFCVVRDPFDRLASAYEYLRPHAGKSGIPDFDWASANLAAYDSFEAFVLALRDPGTRGRVMRYAHFRPQHHWVRLPFGSPCAMDKVGRFETLADDYREVMEQLGVEAPPLPHKRPSQRPPHAQAYTPAMKAIVADMYAEDLRLFGY